MMGVGGDEGDEGGGADKLLKCTVNDKAAVNRSLILKNDLSHLHF